MSNAEHECRQVDLEDAAPALYDALCSALRQLIKYRRIKHTLCSDPDGSIPALEDQEAIAQIDRLVDQCHDALAKARGEE
jgi:hypothetical protein